MPEPADPIADRVLAGRYRLGTKIGSGGMADVYRATDLRLDRDVAIKLFRDGVDPVARRRLTEEATLLARLSCPGLVAVYDFGTAADHPYIVMQLIDGSTLRNRILADPLDVPTMIQLGAHLAEAIGFVHRQGVVHRDIKPSNVLLDQHNRPWLTDFGISLQDGSTRLTATGQLVGTAGYLAPEQVMGQPIGPAADVYALALVLLESLTGMPEYEGGDIEVAVARLHRPPRIPAGLPVPVGQLLTAMTAPEPERRPDAARCAAVLRAVADGVNPAVAVTPVGADAVTVGMDRPALDSGPGTRPMPAVGGPSTQMFDGPLVPPEGPPVAAPRPIMRYLVAAAVGLIAIGIGWAMLSGGPTPPPTPVAVPTPTTTVAPTTAPVVAPVTTTTTPPPPPSTVQLDCHGKGKHRTCEPAATDTTTTDQSGDQ